jgi:hypothetical protein
MIAGIRGRVVDAQRAHDVGQTLVLPAQHGNYMCNDATWKKK